VFYAAYGLLAYMMFMVTVDPSNAHATLNGQRYEGSAAVPLVYMVGGLTALVLILMHRALYTSAANTFFRSNP